MERDSRRVPPLGRLHFHGSTFMDQVSWIRFHGSGFMDQETMANASDGAILTGTVAASIPLAVGIVCGGEVILGVGTVGGTATTGGIGTVVGTEIIDTGAEILIEVTTGTAVPLVFSPVDAIQDGCKFIIKRVVKKPLSATPKKLSDDVIIVTPQGVALPPGRRIPDNYVENPYVPGTGSYDEIADGKFKERLGIDPPTPPGTKGPQYSHHHIDGGKEHLSPRPGANDTWPGE